MKVESSLVTKLHLTELEGLDPITVYVEDFGLRDTPTAGDPDYKSGSGRVTVNCGGRSWTSFWGAIGNQTTSKFFIRASADYIIGSFSPSLRQTQFCPDNLKKYAATCILDRRRGRNSWNWMLDDLGEGPARRLYDEIYDADIGDESHLWRYQDLLSAIFGDEWFFSVDNAPRTSNPDWVYLEKIIETVQSALKQQPEVSK